MYRQFDRILAYTLPSLHAHLDDICLSAEVLASQWFIPMFSYTLPLYLTLHIWDYIFLGGWSAAFRVVVALLSAAQVDLMACDLESMSAKMRCLDWQTFLDHACGLDATGTCTYIIPYIHRHTCIFTYLGKNMILTHSLLSHGSSTG